MILGTVSLVEVNHGKFVAIECSKKRGIVLPGGKVDRGESIKSAAARELKEETGLIAIGQRLIFQSICVCPINRLCFVYAFHTRINHNKFDMELLKQTSEGKIVIVPWAELVNCYKPYYELLYEAYLGEHYGP